MAKAKKTPEGLDGLWDEDTEKAWKKLNPKQQKFLQEWLTNGNHGSNAYRASYNELASDSIAASCASQYLRSPHISVFVNKMCDNNKQELFLAKKVYLEGMKAFKPVFNPEGDSALDVHDHLTRKSCADSLMKLNGEYIERTDNTHHFPEGIDITFTKSDEN